MGVSMGYFQKVIKVLRPFKEFKLYPRVLTSFTSLETLLAAFDL